MSSDPIEVLRRVRQIWEPRSDVQPAFDAAIAALASLSAPKPSGEVRPNYEHMFMAAVESLAEVSVALGIPDDEASAANGNAEMLARIEELKAAAAPKHKAGDNMEAEAGHVQGSELVWAEEHMALHWIDRYAAGIDAEPQMDRILSCVQMTPEPKGEVVVTRDEDGEIVMVSRQDEDGRILNVIATTTHAGGKSPKPESAEAVGDRQAWYEAEIDKAERQWIDGFSRRYEAGDDVPSMSSFVALWLAERTTPPRPEASAPVDEATRRDAKRYRYLRRPEAWKEDYMAQRGASPIFIGDGRRGAAKDGDALDAAIDRILAGQQQGGTLE